MPSFRVEMYYIYSYLREDLSPYYIGKGKDQRAYSKGLNEVRPPKDKSRVQIIKANLTEQEAFELEKLYILMFGRKDNETGILRNKTDGGEGPSGRIDSEETRKRKSIALTGRTIRKETGEKISRVLRSKNIKHSEEHKRHLSEKLKGKKPSEYNILVSKSKAKPHKITFRGGKSIMVSNIVDWSKENGYLHSGIYAVKRGVRNFHRDIIAVELAV
jgi:hypothetical protein